MDTGQQQKLVAAAIRRLDLLKKNEAFDPFHPESRPTGAQQEVIDDFGTIRTQWIVAANQSGKSQTCARLVTWMLTDTHPKWKRPVEWMDEPLLVVVAGRTGKHIEESLLPKIESYLHPGTYKVVRIGNIAQSLELDNGNRIVFQSLENPNVAAERLQSYVAHCVWIDEMPPTTKVLSEAMVRRNTRSGYFLASFTPLVVNDDIRRMVDAAEAPHGKKYRFTMFDNPAYASPEKQAEVLAGMATLPEHVRNTRLYGEWTVNDDAVYYFDYDKMVSMPYGYSPLIWRHVEAVDPALKSALGLTVWAEDPDTNIWYCVLSEYIKGILVPTELVKVVADRVRNMNVIRRIADPHEVWYIQTAGSMGINYIGVYKKNDRKNELIKNLQECLGTRVRLSPSCEDLISELQECRWSDKSDGKIVNGSSYHLLDSSQYFCDNIPKAEKKGPVITNWHASLLMANEKRKAMEEQVQKKLEYKVQRRAIRRRWK